jgi:hypothetical protein
MSHRHWHGGRLAFGVAILVALALIARFAIP